MNVRPKLDQTLQWIICTFLSHECTYTNSLRTVWYLFYIYIYYTYIVCDVQDVRLDSRAVKSDSLNALLRKWRFAQNCFYLRCAAQRIKCNVCRSVCVCVMYIISVFLSV